jgi:hypothetical protein
MTRAHSLSLTTLVLCAALPFAWLACGGSKPPPETPADETASSASPASSSAGDDSTGSAASASSGAAADNSSPPAADTSTAAAPPAAPPLGGTDCGRCIDKTCKAPAAACGKNSDCQSTLDGFHGCGSDKGAAACLDSATPPTAAKPKKLATAYGNCAKKAIAKACKTKCQ